MSFIKTLFPFLLMHCIAFANIDEANGDFFDICKQISGAIDRIEESRCFIKPEKIVLLHGQIYIKDEIGNLVSFPMVCFSDSGIFLPMGSRPSQPQPIWICRKCTWLHYYEPSICERTGCGGTSFLVRYR